VITSHYDTSDLIIGRSAAAEAMRAFAGRAGAVDAPVLLTGESGTGKGILARAIHAASRRARAPFVTVNCASVPDSLFESEFFGHARGAFTGATQPHRGLFEQAHGGTLFLDEVGELSIATQAKLLTVLDERRIRRVGAERSLDVDARLIAATNRDLLQAVAQRTFRDDLYHRLLVLARELPPLREREDDIELLMARFLTLHAQRHGCAVTAFSRRAHAHLRTHPWPGNVRQLDHAVEAAVLACEGAQIELRHLPPSLLRADAAAVATQSPNGGPSRPIGRYSFHGSPAEERRHIEEALRRCHGNKTRAARELGMTRNTLRSRLAALCEPHLSHPAMDRSGVRVQDRSAIEQKRAVGTAQNGASNIGTTE
jgi:DNA-binding NtrC family response regulator